MGKKAYGDDSECMIMQWIIEKTRFRGSEEPSIPDLLFMKRPDLIGIIKFQCSVGKNDHVLIKINILKRIRKER